MPATTTTTICEYRSHPPAAPQDVDVYHDCIRQHETKLQTQYEEMHHGDDEDSSDDADDAADDAAGAEPDGADVAPTEAGGQTATDGGSSLASSSYDAAPPPLAPSEGAPRAPRPACPAPTGPARPSRQLTIASMFSRSA